MEDVSRDDNITRAMSSMRVLLAHLIKRAVEQRTTRLWDESITEAFGLIQAAQHEAIRGRTQA